MLLSKSRKLIKISHVSSFHSTDRSMKLAELFMLLSNSSELIKTQLTVFVSIN